MKKLKNKLLVSVFILLAICFGYYKCSYASVYLYGLECLYDGEIAYQLRNHSRINEFLNMNVYDFLGKPIGAGGGRKQIMVGDKFNYNLSYNNATCLFHEQSNSYVNKDLTYFIQHVIDIDDNMLKVDGMQINPTTFSQKRIITQMAWATVNAYENGKEHSFETDHKFAFRTTLLNTEFYSLVEGKIRDIVTGDANNNLSPTASAINTYQDAVRSAYVKIEKVDTKCGYKMSENSTYLGPFKVTYDNYPDRVHDITVTIDGVDTHIDTRYDGYYVYDSNKKMYARKTGEIPSSNEFYIKVPNIGAKWKVNLTTIARNRYKVRILLFKDHEKGGQNIAIFGGTRYSKNDSIVWEGKIDTLANIKKVDKNNNGLSNVKYVLYNNSQKQYLRINNLNDAKGTINVGNIQYVSRDKATCFTTDSSGATQINGIIPGSYKYEELSNSNYGYRGNNGETYNIDVKAGNNKIVVANPQKLGNLNINKVDSLNSNVQLSGVNFKVGLKEGLDSNTEYYLQLVNSSGHEYRNEKVGSNVTINKNNARTQGEYTVKYVTRKEDATIFTTDGNGQIYINNLEVYYGKDKKYRYYISEVSIDNLGEYYDINGSENSTELRTDSSENTLKTDIIIKNKKERVNIQGYVWEDKTANKNSFRNNLYDNNGLDKRIKNIRVNLKRNGNVIASTLTDGNGEYFFPAKGTYNGKSYEIRIDVLSEYSVEFEYNGLKYQSVASNINKDNGSKVDEEHENGKINYRQSINENFNTIYGENAKNNTGTKGKTGTDVKLNYANASDSVSQLLQNTEYTVNSANEEINPVEKVKVLADTETAKCNLKTQFDNQNKMYNNIYTIKNINLGLYERSQTDLSITTDVDNVKLDINGYSHTYNYQKRLAMCPKISGVNQGLDTILDSFSVSEKNKYNGTYKTLEYERSIDDAYIAYTIENENDNNRLRVFVTYRLLVSNEGDGGLKTKVSLNNYVDSNLELRESYYFENGIKKYINCKTTKNYKEGIDLVYTDGEIDKMIEPNQCMQVYLTYELNTETIKKLAKGDVSLKHNVTEINSYSTFDSSGNVYGSIDRDSAPNNITYDDAKKYEDDTEAAPELKFTRKESKKISGFVFEDNPVGIEKDTLNSGDERKGNGVCEDNENKVQGVKVEIVNCNGNDTGNPVELYKLTVDGKVEVIENNKLPKAQQITNDKGEYSFEGLIPGEYQIKYTYGYYKNGEEYIQTKIGEKTEVTTESYKSTIVDYGTFSKILGRNETYMKNDYNDKNNRGNSKDALWYWYQNENISKYSAAVDNYDKRTKINESLSAINYNTKSTYDNKTDKAENHYIDAITAIFDFTIEGTRTQTTNIDYNGKSVYNINFGITERPRQSIELKKEVSYVKIVLANGPVLVEGDPRKDKINYVTYPENGILKIEIDNEIIEGAKLELTYEISVTNNSERDYNSEAYYKYGIADDSKLVTITLDSIVDYVDEKLSVTYDIDKPGSDFVYYDESTKTNDKWMIILNPSNNKLAGHSIAQDVYKSVQSRKNIVVRNLDKAEVAPKDTYRVNLKASKLLTDLNNTDQIFDNYAEILGVSNSVGRFYGAMYGEKLSTSTWKLNTPGNFNIEDETTSESDNNKVTKATIIPPTGKQAYTIITIIGISCLIIIAGGVIIIKKRVL